MSRAVLFLCTGNACRSQMAEGFARRLLPPEVAVFSAGTTPAGVHPLATAVMAEVGVDISSQRSKSLADVPLGQVDHVVTLCGDAAEHCPVIPAARREHWPLRDPARAQGSEAEILGSFRSIRDEVLSRVLALADSKSLEPAIGIIGGSGFYDLPGLTDAQHVEVETPFGAPSSALVVGRLGARRVVFLARHGHGHALLPSEVNARANIYALKRMGVTKVVSVSAVGSLREEIAPGDVVLPRQRITNLPEARLAREAELCYATLALPTDYDCWRARTEEVRVTDVIAVLKANVEKVRRILARALEVVDPSVPCACHRVLDTALLTPPEGLDAKARLRLHALLARRLPAERHPPMEVAS